MPESADKARQASQFDRNLVILIVEPVCNLPHAIFIVVDQRAFHLALGRISENIEPRTAQFPHRGEHRKQLPDPGTKISFEKFAGFGIAFRKKRRREIISKSCTVFKGTGDRLLERRIAVQPPYFILIFIGHEFCKIAGDHHGQFQ